MFKENGAEVTEPLISIVIPAYNAERYLKACFDSIKIESHPNIQVILVDDGSTDTTPELCDHFAASYGYVTAIHRDNGGLPSARNTGLSHADGTWIWFVDADDVIAPYAFNALEKCCHQSTAEIIKFNYLTFRNSEEPSWQADNTTADVEHFSARDILEGTYTGRFGHYTCMNLFRTSFLKGYAAKPFPEGFSLYEDVVFTESYMRAVKSVDYLPLPLYGYRMNPSSICHRRCNSSADSGLRAVRHIAQNEAYSGYAFQKTRMEMALLIGTYNLIEPGVEGTRLKTEIKREVSSRFHVLGLRNINGKLLLRYVLMRIGLLSFCGKLKR